MTTVVAMFFLIASLVAAVIYASRRMHARECVSKANGSFGRRFVWVADDGSVRELTKDELAYLNTDFHPGDGARPYIKARYSARSPDNRFSGFLLRSKLPRAEIVRS